VALYPQNLTYEHSANKVELVRSGGLQQVLGCVGRHEAELDVARLGLAVLFSTLQHGDATVDVRPMRAVALAHRMLEVVGRAASLHGAAADVRQMAQQLLALAPPDHEPEVALPPRPHTPPRAPTCNTSLPLSPVSAF
jgi:hypothetical protein